MLAWLNGFVRDFLSPLIKAIADRRGRQLAEYAKTACANLEMSDLPSLVKRDMVMAALREEAARLKFDVQEYILAAILEAALAKVRDR
jgi:hypothetical protein